MFAVTEADSAFCSAHIGDMGNLETLQAFERSVAQLTAEGFSKSILSHLLRILTEAGFLSKDWRTGPAPNIYRLHLPPRAQP